MDGSRQLGDAIYQERVRRDLSQQGLAALLGASQSSVHRWEAGRGVPSDRLHFRRISEFLNLPVAEVLALAFVPDEPTSQVKVEERLAEVERRIEQIESELRGGRGC